MMAASDNEYEIFSTWFRNLVLFSEIGYEIEYPDQSSRGHCKSWTLDWTGLDHGLDWTLDWTLD